MKEFLVLIQNFGKILLNKYVRNDVVTFAYAGSFYEKLRNPKYFFKYLNKTKVDFRFIIYTQSHFVKNMILNDFPLLQGKLQFKKFITRKELIYELSSVDFLINFENENTLMVPSKLIDYALSKRPILSFNSKSFDSNKFNDFLKNDFKHSTKINLDDFNISILIKQFLND